MANRCAAVVEKRQLIQAVAMEGRSLSHSISALKDAVITTLIVVSACILGWGATKSIFSDSTHFEPIQIPQAIVEKGYTPQIFTTRLIDELRIINKTSTTTKSRTTISGKAPGEELSKIDNLPTPGGIDIKGLVAAFRDALGIEKKSIGGEITHIGDEKSGSYLVRLRESPGEHLLVNGVFQGPVETVIQQVALSVVEKLDPVVAASYYRNHKNPKDTLRMVEAALTNANKGDDTFALSQRAQLYVSQKKWALAKMDLDQLLALDPNSPQGLGVMSAWHNEQGQFDEGLKYAERQISAMPTMWYAYFNKADSLLGKKEDAENAYEAGLKLNPTRPFAYLDAAAYFSSIQKNNRAQELLREGVAKFPSSAELHLAYAKAQLGRGEKDIATNHLQKAYELKPDEESRLLLAELLPPTDPFWNGKKSR